MTDVLVTTWTCNGIPHTWPGSPQTGETYEDFFERYIDELRKVLGVLPPDKGTELRCQWVPEGACVETRGQNEGESEFIERFIEELLEELEANPPDPS